MNDFVISDPDDNFDLNDPACPKPKPVPSHVVHEVWRKVDCDTENYIVKLGEVTKQISEFPGEVPSSFPGEKNRLIPIQEPTFEDLEKLSHFSENLKTTFDPAQFEQPKEEEPKPKRPINVDDAKPLYTYEENGYLYEYFEL